MNVTRTQRAIIALILVGLALALAGVAFKLNRLMRAEQLFHVGVGVLVLGLLFWTAFLLLGSFSHAQNPGR
jgi:hypothetical protein